MYMLKQVSTQALHSFDGKKIALQAVNIETTFNHLLCETIMSQTYINVEKDPIEAVYTFPLASQAILLGMDVNIGGRELQGIVVEKNEAEEQYEDAIVEGDAAIMLEQVQTGLYTMNVGNILSGEKIRITIRYMELYSWHGNHLRYYLPTTVAPRYGNSEGAGVQPHQTPEYDLIAENRFQLKIIFSGILAKASFECPSHSIIVEKDKETTTVSFAKEDACMDRDFILNIESPQSKKDFVMIDRDGNDGFVALASFCPNLPHPEKIPAKSVKIVVDCSGSMGGDSINQARQAISDILDRLRPEDYFNIIAFGSSHRAYFDHQVQADKENIASVRRLLRSLDANMGGTEMDQALQAAVQIPGPLIAPDILLITDGEVWESDAIISKMKKSEHRVFAVGVGSSVAEGFVRQLADKTGGACEFVIPGEGMTEKIVRHFKRIYLEGTNNIKICWPMEPLREVANSTGCVYDQDTVNVFAHFRKKPVGAVTFNMTLADGQVFSQSAEVTASEQRASEEEAISLLSRMAVWKSLAGLETSAATEMAVRYQLISPYTNYLVVDIRAEDEKCQALPGLRKVPQMLAAGWGGSGTIINESPTDFSDVTFLRRRNDSQACHYQVCHSMVESSGGEDEYEWRQQTTPLSFIHQCNRYHNKRFLPVLQIKSFLALGSCGLPARILDALKEIAGQSYPHFPEEHIVHVFLWILAQAEIGRNFNRDTVRAIKKAKKTLRPDELLIDLMTDVFADISFDDWGLK